MTTQLTLPDPGTVAPLHSEPQIVVDWFWVVHGEESQTLALAERLKELGYSVIVPMPGESIEID